MTTLIGLVLALTPHDPAVELGKLRAAFGDTQDPAIMGGLHRNVMWLRTYFFPEGRADVRYQLDKFGDPGRSFLSKVVNTQRGPTLEWSIELSYVPVAEPDNVGTLESMLFRGGLKPAQTPSPSVQSSLKARKGFAAYRSGTMYEQVAYYYLYPDGSHPTSGSEPGFDKPKGWPLSKEPYPIPAAEAKRLTR